MSVLFNLYIKCKREDNIFLKSLRRYLHTTFSYIFFHKNSVLIRQVNQLNINYARAFQFVWLSKRSKEDFTLKGRTYGCRLRNIKVLLLNFKRY